MVLGFFEPRVKYLIVRSGRGVSHLIRARFHVLVVISWDDLHCHVVSLLAFGTTLIVCELVMSCGVAKLSQEA